MKTDSPFKSLGLLFLVLTLLACNLLAPSSSSSNSSVAPQSTVANQQPQISSQTGCSNPYYPVKKDATWTYKTSGLPTGPSTYVDTITDVRVDGFTDTSVFDNKVTRKADWNCTKDGLLELSLGNGAAAISTSGTQAQITVTKSSGVTIPAKVSTGDSWSYTLDFTGQINMQNTTSQAQGSSAYQLKALGNESVTVPAGTFTAMKVQVAGTFNIQVSMGGVNLPVTISDASLAWYAPNVGMVKLTDNVNMMGSSINATTELQSYKIP